MSAPVALVTGASRGIGKATAIALAEAGFDIAIAARTVREGDGWDYNDPPRPVVGSLDSTAAAIEATGRRVLPLPMDLLDRASLGAAMQRLLDQFGRIDALVNNAVHSAGDHNASFEDVALRTIEDEIEANTLAPVILAKLALPVMLKQGGGVIINVTSAAGYMDPPLRAGKGGWSVSYGLCKGALHRLAGVMALELGDRGIRAFNLQPGYVMTERLKARIDDIADKSHETPYQGAPPAALGKVIAWLASNPEAASFNGKTVEGQMFALERGLYPDWRGPNPGVGSIGAKTSVW
jgi:NAD(P)-dependent dehydrogenase (short-subunit alcohol dehydrogenase family)